MIPAQAAVINLTANMDCAQAGAGAGTCDAGGAGAGVGVMTFDTGSNLLSWDVSYSGLSGEVTAAHFHGPALSNENADIQVGIDILNPAGGSAVIIPAQAAELLAGLWYINIHSTAFTGGEIRGQVSVLPAPVTIDIKPGSDPNSINLKSMGVVPVAVLGSSEFDALQAVILTVTFGPHLATPAHHVDDGFKVHVEDVNDDGLMDMVFHFKTQETGIACGDADATLDGKINDGTQFTGTDTVKTVGCTASSLKGTGAMSWLFLVGLGVLGLWRQKG